MDDRSFIQISGTGRVVRCDFLAAVVTASEYTAGLYSRAATRSEAAGLLALGVFSCEPFRLGTISRPAAAGIEKICGSGTILFQF